MLSAKASNNLGKRLGFYSVWTEPRQLQTGTSYEGHFPHMRS